MDYYDLLLGQGGQYAFPNGNKYLEINSIHQTYKETSKGNGETTNKLNLLIQKGIILKLMNKTAKR